MKNILILLDGNVSQSLLNRMIEQDTSNSNYDIVYTNDNILPDTNYKNFTFYKFDPTSYSKLEFIMKKVNYNNIFIVLNTKEDTLAVVDNISKIRPELYLNVYNAWNIKFDNKHVKNFDALGILSNGLLEQLPHIPITAQNVGLKQGEIMELSIPFGSLYAYRYIDSIEQKNWKIFAVYRNNILIETKASVILKPNDIILIIGKPKVLLQVYSSISKSHGNFPMPFGNNIYVYIDMYIQNIVESLNTISKAKFLYERLKNRTLIVRVVRTSNIIDIQRIKKKLANVENCILEFEYNKNKIDSIIEEDKRKFDIGVVVLSPTLLKKPYVYTQVIKLKIAIFKAGKENIKRSKESVVVINNNKEYEQISPIIFDVSALFNHKLSIINADPIGNRNSKKLLEHFKNLSDIFAHNMHIEHSKKNPVRLLKKRKAHVQIMPLKHLMFKQNIFKIFSMDSDLISFEFDTISQILIPIIEESKEYTRRIDDI
jgi:hypothetical protein